MKINILIYLVGSLTTKSCSILVATGFYMPPSYKMGSNSQQSHSVICAQKFSLLVQAWHSKHEQIKGYILCRLSKTCLIALDLVSKRYFGTKTSWLSQQTERKHTEATMQNSLICQQYKKPQTVDNGHKIVLCVLEFFFSFVQPPFDNRGDTPSHTQFLSLDAPPEASRCKLYVPITFKHPQMTTSSASTPPVTADNSKETELYTTQMFLPHIFHI